jgi:hypothetical protein
LQFCNQLLEKLWKAAYVFHAEGSLEAHLWVLDVIVPQPELWQMRPIKAATIASTRGQTEAATFGPVELAAITDGISVGSCPVWQRMPFG